MRASRGPPTVRRLGRALAERLTKIELMIFDVDGDRDDSGSEDDDEELLETPPRPTAPPPQR